MVQKTPYDQLDDKLSKLVEDHNKFLDLAVKVGFDKLIADESMTPLAASIAQRLIPVAASALRDICIYRAYIDAWLAQKNKPN